MWTQESEKTDFFSIFSAPAPSPSQPDADNDLSAPISPPLVCFCPPFECRPTAQGHPAARQYPGRIELDMDRIKLGLPPIKLEVT
jgi:hypothetical protein